MELSLFIDWIEKHSIRGCDAYMEMFATPELCLDLVLCVTRTQRRIADGRGVQEFQDDFNSICPRIVPEKVPRYWFQN